MWYLLLIIAGYCQKSDEQGRKEIWTLKSFNFQNLLRKCSRRIIATKGHIQGKICLWWVASWWPQKFSFWLHWFFDECTFKKWFKEVLTPAWKIMVNNLNNLKLHFSEEVINIVAEFDAPVPTIGLVSFWANEKKLEEPFE